MQPYYKLYTFINYLNYNKQINLQHYLWLKLRNTIISLHDDDDDDDDDDDISMIEQIYIYIYICNI